jgi:nitric oxide reductase activation protein
VKEADMEVQLDLSAHCIETEIKKRYNLEISAYYKAALEEQQRLGPIIDMLRAALETFDFAELRTRHPELAGGADHNVRLFVENKQVSIAIDNTTIYPHND